MIPKFAAPGREWSSLLGAAGHMCRLATDGGELCMLPLVAPSCLYCIARPPTRQAAFLLKSSRRRQQQQRSGGRRGQRQRQTRRQARRRLARRSHSRVRADVVDQVGVWGRGGRRSRVGGACPWVDTPTDEMSKGSGAAGCHVYRRLSLHVSSTRAHVGTHLLDASGYNAGHGKPGRPITS
jgi:hypothetical protein